MGKEQPAEYYDSIYAKLEQYRKNWRESRYRKVWELMAENLDKEIHVVDLGCGPGQAAGLLKSLGFERYSGYDFSKEAIDLAHKVGLGKNYEFECTDLFNLLESIPDNWTCAPALSAQIFCSETLEHIEKDLELMELVQRKFPGCRISYSVPSFDDPGHVRHFKTIGEVQYRYQDFVFVEQITKVGPWFVARGVLNP